MPWPCELVNHKYMLWHWRHFFYTNTGPAPRRIARPDGAIGRRVMMNFCYDLEPRCSQESLMFDMSFVASSYVFPKSVTSCRSMMILHVPRSNLQSTNLDLTLDTMPEHQQQHVAICQRVTEFKFCECKYRVPCGTRCLQAESMMWR
jgi:hypothetical protein